jgi:hypothetical protein
MLGELVMWQSGVARTSTIRGNEQGFIATLLVSEMRGFIERCPEVCPQAIHSNAIVQMLSACWKRTLDLLVHRVTAMLELAATLRWPQSYYAPSACRR